MSSSTKECRGQRAKILEVLIRARGQEVPLPQILELRISQFGARILELRRAGFHIVNRTETIDGVRRSWYRLAGRPEMQASPRANIAQTAPQQELPDSDSLFGALAPERYPD